MTFRLFSISTLLLLSINIIAQNTTFKTKKFVVNKLHTTDPVQNKVDFQAQIINLEAPNPNGESYKSFLMQQKIKSKSLFPYKNKSLRSSNASDVPQPIVLNSFGMMEINSIGDTVPSYGGLPNDNTAAISNDGILLLSLNSKVYLHDTNADTIMYPNEVLTFRQSLDLPFGNYYDPKVLYDNVEDRFILLFLKNNNPATSEIMIGFSKTNNPLDGWHVYSLPGNPLNNNRWTDFPTISLTDEYLYFSANLIVPGVSWQIGFDGSILWEMNKAAGYSGATSIEPKLYNDIRFEDKYIRNLHCVSGAEGNVDNLHMFSNRNFDITNDTIFLVTLKEANPDSSYLDVKAIVSDTKYGVPPNARQADTDTSDATKGLQTNDARVLAAIQFEDQIQFVSNTINPETGLVAIYHGTVNELYDAPSITANVIADNVKDFGYPNLAWTGNEACDRETMIAFNHTSFTDSAGISVVYYNNEGNYSDVLELRKGKSIVDRISNDSNERWGDYFGMQRKYNEPGKVFTFGFTTDDTRRNFGWVNELFTPDTNVLAFTYEISSTKNYCENTIIINAYGGIPPYKVEWDNSNTNTSLSSSSYCNGDTSSFTIFDSRDCVISDKIYFPIEDKNKQFTLFPNPTNDLLAFQFTTEEKTVVEVNITDSKGSFVKQIVYQEVKAGLNELYFSTEPLPKGIYFVEIISGKKKLSKNKFVKN